MLVLCGAPYHGMRWSININNVTLLHSLPIARQYLLLGFNPMVDFIF